MSLSRVYEPFFSFSDFDRLFDEAFAARTSDNSQVSRTGSAGGPLRPRMDLHEDEKANVVTATFELPGLRKEDVQIDVHNNMLSVSGESKISSERDENGYAVRERRYGKFSRTIPLPQGIKPEDIKASMENGVLSVTFPKTTPEMAPKKITIS
ncbi:HSP20-like chaperone [Gloeophyllum trabeum ATCC 11539]|uniref:HSP20-like chaperone n=1 Tax=Gloeophyllum trabeum (strain ATCC 11539 / FP-39264 / Madison 617) TaxID=670483 RepID=S7QMH6_GLOTA|nr:HSP20-like chaperone [Gloeophyllum trabeum ATCC 11539]EPQ60766.1 HSP20-like chaperone [Gloeophyllum trabeum ATCC 11539]|eukprot:PLAT10790.1.p1 GENE.PLAT10790.1~~PLAT10790.1.p1  ORF type:complete len:153 (-),score=3.76 PLAT10790.1:158-616(-)